MISKPRNFAKRQCELQWLTPPILLRPLTSTSPRDVLHRRNCGTAVTPHPTALSSARSLCTLRLHTCAHPNSPPSTRPQASSLDALATVTKATSTQSPQQATRSQPRPPPSPTFPLAIFLLIYTEESFNHQPSPSTEEFAEFTTKVWWHTHPPVGLQSSSRADERLPSSPLKKNTRTFFEPICTCS